MIKCVLLLILSVVVFGCGTSPEDKTEYKPESLYRQRIANSKYVIYEFFYPGAFVTISDYKGLTIIDSTATLTESKIEKLPCDYFDGKPQIDDLKMIDINSMQPSTANDTLLTPSKKYVKEYSRFNVSVTEYKETYGSAIANTGLMEYDFDGFKETNDSLIFYKIKKRFGGKPLRTTTSFVKGNIKIIESVPGQIDHIEIEQAIITRGDIYKPTKPLELVPDQPITGFAIYYFYPEKQLAHRNLQM